MDKQVFTIPQNIKNSRGQLGPICNYCGGYGFTNGIKGSATCPDCRGDGIQPVNVRELQTQVMKLTNLVGRLVKTLDRKGDILE